VSGMHITSSVLAVVIVAAAGGAQAQVAAVRPAGARAAASAPQGAPSVAGVVPAADYVIGPEDVLSVVFWRDKDMSAEVSVRPDGKISLPLLNDVQASGLTPQQLRDTITEAAKRYIEDPSVSVVIRQINSRKVYVTGEVIKPGPYLLTGPTTVLQMIAIAGGLREYADAKHITLMRVENGRTVGYPFNYKDVSNRKSLSQNVELKPGDTIVVP
jgi:polysaccharide biosynthesis/export protein